MKEDNVYMKKEESSKFIKDLEKISDNKPNHNDSVWLVSGFGGMKFGTIGKITAFLPNDVLAINWVKPKFASEEDELKFKENPSLTGLWTIFKANSGNDEDYEREWKKGLEFVNTKCLIFRTKEEYRVLQIAELNVNKSIEEGKL